MCDKAALLSRQLGPAHMLAHHLHLHALSQQSNRPRDAQACNVVAYPGWAIHKPSGTYSAIFYPRGEVEEAEDYSSGAFSNI